MLVVVKLGTPSSLSPTGARAAILPALRVFFRPCARPFSFGLVARDRERAHDRRIERLDEGPRSRDELGHKIDNVCVLHIDEKVICV